jgi:hypothetical protein
MPVILATQEAEIRRITVQSQPGQIVRNTLSRKYPAQKGLAKWLKVKALSSSPSTAKKKNKTVLLLGILMHSVIFQNLLESLCMSNYVCFISCHLYLEYESPWNCVFFFLLAPFLSFCLHGPFSRTSHSCFYWLSFSLTEYLMMGNRDGTKLRCRVITINK